MSRGTSWLPNTHNESAVFPFRYVSGQPAAHELR
jgi:hypothetical protein